MKRFTSLILTATLFCLLLSGCGKKCYICGESGANYELVGYDLCHDCYMQVLENTEDEPSYHVCLNGDWVYRPLLSIKDG